MINYYCVVHTWYGAIQNIIGPFTSSIDAERLAEELNAKRFSAGDSYEMKRMEPEALPA